MGKRNFKLKIMNEKLQSLLQEIDNQIETPFVTPKFGNQWREHAKENYDFESVINIAWKQGRRAILLERLLDKLVPSDDEAKVMAGKYAEENEEYYKHSHVKSVLFNAFLSGCLQMPHQAAQEAEQKIFKNETNDE